MLASATGHEAIGILLYKISLRPNANMDMQGARLKALLYEERDAETLKREMHYYKVAATQQ
jgi:hypothetical protein